MPPPFWRNMLYKRICSCNRPPHVQSPQRDLYHKCRIAQFPIQITISVLLVVRRFVGLSG